MISRNFSFARPEAICSAARLLPFRDRCHAPAQQKHPARQFQAQVTQVGRAAPVKHFEHLDDLEGVAHGAAERLIHVRDQRNHALAHARARLDQKIGKMRGILFALHECARAHFHVQHKRVDPLRQLLAHDRAANQGRAFHRGGDVAQGVQLLIGRSDLGRLADERAAANAEHAAEVRERQIHAESPEWTRACRACRRYDRVLDR